MIYFLYFLKNIRSDSYSSALIRCWGIIFFCSFTITLIYSIVSGVYNENVFSLKTFYADGHLVLRKNIDHFSAIRFSKLIEKKHKNIKLLPFGITQAFFIDEKSSIVPVVLIVKTNEFSEHMSKNGILNKKNDGFACGKQFSENNNLSIDEKYSIVVSGVFSKISGLIKCLPINLKFKEKFDFKLDDLNGNAILIDSEVYKKNYSKEFINRFIIVFKDDKGLSEENKRTFLKKTFNERLVFWQELYFEFYSIMERQRISSLLMCFLLFLFSLVLVLQLISIFLSNKKEALFFLLTQGMPFLRIYFSQIILVSASTTVFSFIGCLSSLFISFISNKYELFSCFLKIDMNSNLCLSKPYLLCFILVIAVFIVSFLKVHFYVKNIIKNRAEI